MSRSEAEKLRLNIESIVDAREGGPVQTELPADLQVVRIEVNAPIAGRERRLALFFDEHGLNRIWMLLGFCPGDGCAGTSDDLALEKALAAEVGRQTKAEISSEAQSGPSMARRLILSRLQ